MQAEGDGRTEGHLKVAPLSVDVTSGNRWGRAYVEGTANTRSRSIRRYEGSPSGQGGIGDLELGDRVLVQAKVCKADLKNNATPALTARMVVAHPAKAEKDDAENDD